MRFFAVFLARLLFAADPPTKQELLLLSHRLPLKAQTLV
jgi:hypothetical protein